MSEIFVTNYFTKGKLLPGVGMEELEERCIENIADILERNASNPNYRKIGDQISEALSQLDVESVPEYTKLPVSSLMGHLRTTAAIAVALAIERGFSSEVDKIRISALLHDIGKIRVFSEIEKGGKGKFTDHVKYTEEILRNAGTKGIQNPDSDLGEFWKRVISIAPRHHTPDYYENYQAKGDLHRIVADADSIASAANRLGDLNIDMDKGTLKNDSPFPHMVLVGGDKKCVAPGDIIEIRKGEPITVPTLHGEISEPKFSLELPSKIGLLYLDIHGIQRFIGESKKLPEIAGASRIIEEKVAGGLKKVVSSHLSSDNVVYLGGGNMLAIVPTDEKILGELKKDLEEVIHKESKGALGVTVSSTIFETKDFYSRFGECVESVRKSAASTISEVELPPTQVSRSTEMCMHCGLRKATTMIHGERVCEVCLTKYESRPDTGPANLENVGDNIAVVIADGNMMGRLFASSKTPTEYAYKSKFVKDQMKKIVKDVLPENARLLYVGGDDVMFILDSKLALSVTKELINRMAEEFRYKPGYADCPDSPMVTLSAGIAMADHKFPVYFLIEKAKKLEAKSKKRFRDNVDRENNFFKLPEGAVSLSVVTSSMPTERDFSFVFPEEKRAFDTVLRFVRRVTGKDRDAWHSPVSLLINSGTSMEERLNLTKFLYSKLDGKQILLRAAVAEGKEPKEIMEELAEVLTDETLLLLLKDIIPMVWQKDKEVDA